MEPTIQKRAETLKTKDMIHMTLHGVSRWFEVVKVESPKESTHVYLELLDAPCAPEDREIPWIWVVHWMDRFDVISEDSPAVALEDFYGLNRAPDRDEPLDVPETPLEAFPGVMEGLESQAAVLVAVTTAKLRAIMHKWKKMSVTKD